MQRGKNLSSRLRDRRAPVAALLLIALGSLALGGCSSSSSAPPEATAAQKSALMNFDLSQCTQIDTGLFKCPAVDKPVCNPDFARSNDVDCVKIGKDGSLYVER